jgi:hypothetical protein
MITLGFHVVLQLQDRTYAVKEQSMNKSVINIIIHCLEVLMAGPSVIV